MSIDGESCAKGSRSKWRYIWR